MSNETPQARLNLKTELMRPDGETPRTFESVRLESEDEWNALLARARVTNTHLDDATPTSGKEGRDLVVFYTGLYRALTFPRRLDEPGPSGVEHWSPYGGRGTRPGWARRGIPRRASS